MQIIKPQFLSTRSNIVYPSCKCFGNACKSLARGYLPFGAIFVDVGGDTTGDVELVWVGVRRLGFAKPLNLAGTKFKVLLKIGRQYSYNALPALAKKIDG